MATAFYDTDSKKAEFKGNVSDLVTAGFTTKQAITTQSAIDLFMDGLFSKPELFVTESGIDFTNIRRLAKIATGTAVGTTKGL